MNVCSQAGSTEYFSKVSDGAIVVQKHNASFTDNINNFANKLKARVHDFKLAHPRFFVFMKHSSSALATLAAAVTLFLVSYAATLMLFSIPLFIVASLSMLLMLMITQQAITVCIKAYDLQGAVHACLQEIDPEQKNDLASWIFKLDCNYRFIDILNGLTAEGFGVWARRIHHPVARDITSVNIPQAQGAILTGNIELASKLYDIRFIEKMSELSDKQRKKLTDALASSMADACISSYKALGLDTSGINNLKSSDSSKIAAEFSHASSLISSLVEATRNGNIASYNIGGVRRKFTHVDAVRAERVINEALTRQIAITLKVVGSAAGGYSNYMTDERRDLLRLMMKFRMNRDIMNVISRLQHAVSIETFLEAPDYSPDNKTDIEVRMSYL